MTHQHDGHHAQKSTDGGQIALIVLVVLAAVASVIMLLTDSAWALKLALVAALWAACIGFILVFRYRSQATEALQREQESYKLADEREARHNEELRAAREGLPVVESTDERTAEMLGELREEITKLRAQIEELSGRSFGYEQAAIRAESRRILELNNTEASATKPSFAAEPEAEPEPRVEPRVEPKPEPAPARATVTEVEPEPVKTGSHRRPQGAPSADAVAGKLGRQPQRPTSPNPLSALITENKRREQNEQEAAPKQTSSYRTSLRPQSEAKPAAEPVAEPPAEPAPKPAWQDRIFDWETDDTATFGVVKDPEPQPAAEDEAARHGRRRRDENTTGVSVAELLANMRKGDK
ncbi:DUF6779 domain-containing protein [Corynebacterium tapiri]|uniref:DUF6779 domain-containing protein n=1 Tax=Corynebacterium tapiri TaxID=1448266 RepID=A0A5C4U309_9CORY|nr:DUF6779 domain-containing protein [Corynebacterium tapiri]TNL96041.1 hypothetical protein FHE74_08400 [Corynebacterium tapiri]